MTRKNFFKSTPILVSGTDVTSDFAGQQRGGDGAESDWRNQYEILDLAPRY